jgi:hypothetical protein
MIQVLGRFGGIQTRIRESHDTFLDEAAYPHISQALHIAYMKKYHDTMTALKTMKVGQ